VSGWRYHTVGPSPFHVWPEWQADRPHDLTTGTMCWCQPASSVETENGRAVGVLLTHRPTFRQRLHLWPTQVKVAARRARKALRDRANH
jgi:hypothetical protein